MKPQCLGCVAKMIRSLLSRSHIIIPHSIQRQPTLVPAEACFIVLFTVTPTCVCGSCTSEQFYLFIFFIFTTTLQVAECNMARAVDGDQMRSGWNSKNESNFPMRSCRDHGKPFAVGRGRSATQSVGAGRGGRRSSLNCVLWECDFFCAVSENLDKHLLLWCVTVSLCYNKKRSLFKKKNNFCHFKDSRNKQADCCKSVLRQEGLEILHLNFFFQWIQVYF